MKTSTLMALGFAVCGICTTAASTPVDGEWTGAEDGFFTNRQNWAANVVPGRYLALDGEGNLITNGVPGGTVIFGDNLTGAKVTTIDFDGVYSVTNLTVSATANRYTLGTSAEQFIPIESRGIFVGGATRDTLVPTIAGKLCVGVECDTPGGYGKDYHCFRNESSETLVIGHYGNTTKRLMFDANGKVITNIGSEFGLRFYGAGDIRLTQKPGTGISNPHTYNYMTGTLYLDAELYFRSFYFYSETSADYDKVRRIVVGENGSFRNNAGFYAVLTSNSRCPVEISGPGWFTQSSGGNAGANYNPHVKSAMFSCASPMTITTPMALKETRPTGYESVVLGIWYTGGAGPLTLAPPENGSTVKGLFRFTSSSSGAVLALSKVGLRGTYGDHGDEDFSFCNNGTLRYIGVGETCNRHIAITNQLAQNKDTSSTYPASGVLEQAGTGEWRVISPVILTGPSSGTLTFKNNTAVDAVYAGTMTGDIAFTKTGTGTWKIDSAAGYTGETIVSAGTLAITKNGSIANSSAVSLAAGTELIFEGDASGVAQSCPTVKVAGPLAKIRVAGGCTVSFAALEIDSGSLDIITADDTAIVKVTGLSGEAPSNLTFNGERAVFDAEGRIGKFTVPDATVTVPVHGGVIADDAAASVGIVDGGTGGNVTLAAAQTAVKGLTQQAAADATVAIGAGRSLTVEMLAIEKDKAKLAIGEADDEGSLRAANGGFTLYPESPDSELTVRAKPDLAAATYVSKLGEGTAHIVKDFDYSGNVAIEDGKLAVTPLGTRQNFTLSGKGVFVKEGKGDWTASGDSSAFTGDYVVSGGMVQPGALDASKIFGIGGDLVLTNGAKLKLFGGGNGYPDYGEKRLHAAAGSAVEIDVMHSSAIGNPFRRLKLAGDLVVTGSVENSSKDTWLVGNKNNLRGEVDLSGHKILKNGYGRIGFKDADFISSGEIELTETPGFINAGAGNLLMFGGEIKVAEGEKVTVATSNGVSICFSGATEPLPMDWTIGGTSYLGTWNTGRLATNRNNWGGTINVTNADSMLSLYAFNESTRQLIVSGKITGLGSVSNNKRAGRYFLTAPTNDYKGTTHFEFPDGSGSYGAVAFARSTTLPDFSKATFMYYGGACLRLSGDGSENTAWPLTEVGRLLREATFHKDFSFAGLDLADTGDFTMKLSDLGDAPAADKVFGFGRYGFYPDDHVLTVNLDTAWNVPNMTLANFTGTMRLQGAGNPLTLDYMYVTGDCSTSTGIVEVVKGAELRLNRVTLANKDNSRGFLRVADGGRVHIAGNSNSYLGLGNCTGACGILELGEGGEVVLGGTDSSTYLNIGAGTYSYGGAIYQTGGNMTFASGTHYFGNGASGYWHLSGGTTTFSGASVLTCSAYTNVPALIHISGGTMAFTGTAAPAVVGAKQSGHGHIYLTGGSMLFNGTASGRAMEWPQSWDKDYDSTGVITLDGADARLAVINTQNIFLANQTNGVAIINLNAGTLEASDIRSCVSGYPGSAAYINFNGGTLKACSSTTDWVQKLTRAEVGPKGAVFDTAGYDAVFTPSLTAPFGQGVKAVDWSYAQKVEAPYFVTIIGDGSGATAIVEYDRATRLMTGIRILSEGSGYTWAKARITSGQTAINYSGCYFKEVDCVLGEVAAPGGFVKRGAGKLTLTGTANNWGGDTVVEGGLLEIGADGALPENAHIVLKGGGISAVSGVAMPTAIDVALSASQLADKKARYVLMSYPDGIPATLPTFNWTDQEPVGAWQVCAEGNSLVLRYVKGTMLYFR